MSIRFAVAMAMAAVFLAPLALAPRAHAAAPEFVLQMPSATVEAGDGAAELDWPNAIVGKPSGENKGHVYIAEVNNARISEYTAWGDFVKAWGWGVANGEAKPQTCGPATPEATPPPALCQQGIAGGGKGQLNRPVGIAIDPAGNLYVFEWLNYRVQKFGPSGEFLVMFGGDVNATKVGEGAPAAERNRCPVALTDECQAGTPGTGPGSFSEQNSDTITYSPTEDAVIVGDKGRIEKFNPDGTFKEEIAFTGALEAFNGENVVGLDADAAGNIYFSVSGLDDVYKVSPSGEPLEPGKPGASKFEVGNPGGMAVDVEGSVYAIGQVAGKRAIAKFDETGLRLVPTKEEEERGEIFPFIPPSGPGIFGIATNICAGSEAPGSLYATFFDAASSLSYVNAYGTGPVGCEEPPPRPPVISEQYAASVTTEGARVRALINPRFFKDTTYFVEYGEGRCSEGGCDRRAPLSDAPLTSKVLNKPVATASVVLSGLAPGRTYHYRFVAQSSGGGPVYGIDPDGEGPGEANQAEGREGTLRTFALPAAQEACPANEAFRTGPSSQLPDCRAYELVSPLDKENGDAGLLPSTKVFFEVNQSATSGERFTYSSITPFADPQSAPFISQFLAERDPASGWSSEDISPPRSSRPVDLEKSLNNEFKAFSEDLCMGWLRHNSASTLGPGAIAGFPNLYGRENCAEPPSYEALSTAPPPSRPASNYLLFPLGFSEDGKKSFFVANDKLGEDAPAPKAEELLLYVHSPAGLRFVCYLPNGEPNPTACAPGMLAGLPDGKLSAEQNAVSADGSRVFWTAYQGGLGEVGGIPGKIYLRLNPDQEQSEFEGSECSEADKACTIAVSTTISPEPAQFWGASDDGSRVVFKFTAGAVKDQLWEFDVETETSSLIAAGVEGPMGLSEDAGRIYLASSKVLAPGGSEGAHNLYFYDAAGGGSFEFIMGLTHSDLHGDELRPGAVNEVPPKRTSKVSADGLHAAFSSTASPTPTGYDNTDLASGKPDEEVYLYDAGAGELRCVSCNPTNARPAGAESVVIWQAARLPGPKVPLQSPRTLSEDGNRLFFESHEALVPGDGNGTWDVYQWEAPGTGSCDEADPTFGPASGGCVELISSGDSAAESRFLDADPSGNNVFIGTLSSLIASDFGSGDVYDARIGGGFPIPQPKAPCEGGACQSPPAPPAELTPGSASFQGKGNVRKAKRCKRGTRKVKRHGKVRCVKKKHKQGAKKRAAHKRRAKR